MADTYINFSDTTKRWLGESVVTAKPMEFGGSHGREKATVLGLVHVLKEVLPELGFAGIGQTTFSLVGFGQVGSWAGRSLFERGAKLKAVLDHTVAIHNELGMDVTSLATRVETTGIVCGFTQQMRSRRSSSTPFLWTCFYPPHLSRWWTIDRHVAWIAKSSLRPQMRRPPHKPSSICLREACGSCLPFSAMPAGSRPVTSSGSRIARPKRGTLRQCTLSCDCI